MKRILLALYAIAAVVVLLYPALSEAKLSANHNETLVRDMR